MTDNEADVCLQETPLWQTSAVLWVILGASDAVVSSKSSSTSPLTTDWCSPNTIPHSHHYHYWIILGHKHGVFATDEAAGMKLLLPETDDCRSHVALVTSLCTFMTQQQVTKQSGSSGAWSFSIKMTQLWLYTRTIIFTTVTRLTHSFWRALWLRQNAGLRRGQRQATGNTAERTIKCR